MKFNSHVFIFFLLIHCSVQTMRSPFLYGAAAFNWINAYIRENTYIEKIEQQIAQSKELLSMYPKYPDRCRCLQSQTLDRFLRSVLPDDKTTRQASDEQRNMDALGCIISKWNMPDLQGQLKNLAFSMGWEAGNPFKIFGNILKYINYEEHQGLPSRYYMQHDFSRGNVPCYSPVAVRAPLFFIAMTTAKFIDDGIWVKNVGNADILEQLFVCAGNQIPVAWENKEHFIFLPNNSAHDPYDLNNNGGYLNNKEHFLKILNNSEYPINFLVLKMITLEAKNNRLDNRNRQPNESINANKIILKKRVLKHPAIQGVELQENIKKYLNTSVQELKNSDYLFHRIRFAT